MTAKQTKNITAANQPKETTPTEAKPSPDTKPAQVTKVAVAAKENGKQDKAEHLLAESTKLSPKEWQQHQHNMRLHSVMRIAISNEAAPDMTNLDMYKETSKQQYILGQKKCTRRKILLLMFGQPNTSIVVKVCT